jgi:hypothetical protein
MNKLIAVAVSSLCALGLSAGQASAWGCRSCCCSCKCGALITAHQYNAFSAFCPDGISFKGCCPLPFGCFQQPGCQPAPQPACSAGYDGGYLGELPAPGEIMTGMPAMAAPAVAAPNFQPPAPTPVENTQSFNYGPPMQQMPFNMIPAAGYQPVYGAGYYPAGGPMVPAPLPLGMSPGY